MSETIYIIAEKVNGPAGHGEPRSKYLALGRSPGMYESGDLLPAFLIQFVRLILLKRQTNLL